MSRPRRRGGRSRAQTIAIVAEYWRKGWTVAEVAQKLRMSEGQVFAIFLHVAATEGDQLSGPGVYVDASDGTLKRSS